MPYVGKTPSIGNFQVCDAISVVNGQAAYTMQVGGVNVSPESANHMIVSLNGVIQKPTDAFTVSGSTITFASNLVTGDVIDFIQILGNVLDLGVPSDNTVTTAKLSDSSVTTAKLNDASVSLAKLTATGTKDATTFLRGDNTFAEAGGGKVLQVVQGTQTTPVLTSSSSYVTTNLTASITPSSSSNKILIMTTLTVSNRASGGEMMCTLYRDASNIITQGSQNGFNQNFNSAGRQDATAACVYLDSPSSTSSTAYTVYIKAQGGSCESMSEGTTGTIVLMEIDA